MSRYQGRHRTTSAPAWRSGRVAVPAVAAATLTLTAAGVAQAASNNNSSQAGASFTLGKPHATTTFDRVEQRTASRSQSRANAQVASQVQKAVAARAAQQKAAAAKAAADKAAKQRSAALDALTKSSSASVLTAAPAPTTSETTEQSASTSSSASASKTTTSRSTSSSSSQSSSSQSSNDSSDGSSSSSSSGWIFPIAGSHYISSGFGHRASPGGIGSTNHMGDDFPTAIGTPLRAMKSGTVTKVGWYGGQGMRVEIDFGGGVSAVYAHMSAFRVSVGEQVGQGEIVGYSGNTGNSTGPHLHLEIHINGVPINPAPWLAARGLL